MSVLRGFTVFSLRSVSKKRAMGGSKHWCVTSHISDPLFEWPLILSPKIFSWEAFNTCKEVMSSISRQWPSFKSFWWVELILAFYKGQTRAQILGNFWKSRSALYPITPLKGAPRLRVHAPLNGITLHAPLTRRKVEASSPRIRVKNQVKFTLFAVNVPK